MANKIGRDFLNDVQRLEDEASAQESYSSWRLDQKLFDIAMIDLWEVPRADLFFGEQTIQDSVVIGDVFVFVPVSKDSCMEIEKWKVVGLGVVKSAEVLAQPDEVTVQHNWQKVSIIVFSYDFSMHGFAEVVADLFLNGVERLRWTLLLVKKDIGIFVLLKFELSFKRFIFSTEAVFLDTWDFDFLDKLVVKTVPFAVRVDERKIMTSFWSTRVNHCTSQIVGVILVWQVFSSS